MQRLQSAPFVLSQRIMDVYLSDQLAPAAPVAVPAGTAGSLLSGILREIGDLPGAYFSEELDVRWTIHPGSGDITGIWFVKLR